MGEYEVLKCWFAQGSRLRGDNNKHSGSEIYVLLLLLWMLITQAHELLYVHVVEGNLI